MSNKPDIRARSLAVLQDSIGHAFADLALLEQALTHISAIKAGTGRATSYQRLEFLGDRVLGLCIADLLFRTFPEAEEGDLSRRLAERVRKEACTAVAVSWNLGACLQLGVGESQSGGRRNAAILADSCEAVLGAVFLDAGYDVVRKVVESAFGRHLHDPALPIRDAKTALQEWAQGLKHPPPVYAISERSGPDHAPRFTVEVQVEGHEPGLGYGTSRRAAEQDAARTLLVRHHVWEDGA
jgi:ribonuclease III